MFDAAVIGTGPAGLSAAINLKLLGKSVLRFGPPAGSDKVERSEKIANYPGLGLLSGAELNRRFREHAAAMEIETEDKMVTLIARTDEGFTLLADNETVDAKTVVLATGAVTAKGFEGEAEYLGRGVSDCATCDGFLYRGKTIAVFLGAPRFEHEAEYLASLAEKVWLFAGYRGCAVRGDNVVLLDSPIVKVSGGLKANAVILRDGREIPVDGLFCLRFPPGIGDAGGRIRISPKLIRGRSRLGLYAASILTDFSVIAVLYGKGPFFCRRMRSGPTSGSKC